MVSRNVLEVNNLTVAFSDQDMGGGEAVRGIQFNIKQGSTVAIVGESGSGKSATALAIMGLLPDQAICKGDIRLLRKNGQPVLLSKISDRAYAKVRGNDMSMIFQEPMSSLNPVISCGEQVMEVLVRHRKMSRSEAYSECIKLFDQVKLPRIQELIKSYPHQLSGGQKQRVMIAMALACRPQLIIADEPTTALDLTVQKEIMDLLQDLQNRFNTALLFVSHDLSLVSQIADEVLVMRDGEIVESGNVWQVFSRPAHPYTMGLLACRPRMNIKLKKLPVVSDFMSVERSDGRFSEQKYKSVGEALLKNARSQREVTEAHAKIYSQLPLLEVKNVSVSFPPQQQSIFLPNARKRVMAVDDVSLNVYPGESLGLVGESGCGKSSLARAILRLQKIDAGVLTFRAYEISSYKQSQLRRLRKDMQIIFQDPFSSLNPKLTIRSSFLEIMKIHQVGKNTQERIEKIAEILQLVGLLPDMMNRFPNAFSGGQRQRITIARTLLLEPEFIICDESVSALDVSVQAQVLNLLNHLKSKFNFTFLLISHDLAVVKFFCDRILVMKDGKIVEEGMTDTIFNGSTNEYTQKLIQAIPKGELEDIRKAQQLRQQHRESLA
ncbi:MAG: ABC transporter ATP-binding protein [Cyclobacteriaceae bacterium]|nr:ABC transporter ATP-binding protein [Cyclobacteriaceae bacterium]MCH8514698.1 ABC transporter ATP-binding protein [Cyclobacteriaceae bacterium]